MIGLLMRTPSPQRGEGWGEGALTERLYPLTPPSPPWGEGEERASRGVRRHGWKFDVIAGEN
jgi:hypothetical protein